LNELLPAWDAVERHATMVRAPAERVYRAVRTTNLLDSPVITLLLLLRALPSRLARRGTGGRMPRRLAIEDIAASSFLVLADDPPREIVLGVAGRFWELAGGRVRLADAAAFRAFAAAGTAKAVWNFRIDPASDDAVRLTTETRVLCLDSASRRRFRRYWRVVGPFSALIRREMLRVIRRDAERSRAKA
jgi:hypothetical protein